MITKDEILKVQEKWGNGIIKIGEIYNNGGDYESEAIQFIDRLYSYNFEYVLFKPTLASDKQFRLDKIGALSYFIGGNKRYVEDSGFAVKGWKSIRQQNAGIKIFADYAICMGNYFFGSENNEDLKVEYTMAFKKIDGNLKIILHDSHLPYKK